MILGGDVQGWRRGCCWEGSKGKKKKGTRS